jgi:hypothetical protein
MPHSDDIFQSVSSDKSGRISIAWAVVSTIIIFTAIGAIFVGGEFVQRSTYYAAVRSPELQARLPSVRNSFRNNLRDMAHNTFPEVRPPWLRDGLLESGLPIYDLRIDPDDLKLLQDTAEVVTAIGHSRDVVREYVDADFLLDGKWVPIKVKLRGYTSQHYRKRIASFRLNFPNEQLFHGKEQVNLSATYDKGLTADITANWELSRYGILTWEDDFVILRVNGELAAMYQETEQFDRSISDRARRAEGFIFAGHGQLYGPEGLGFSKATEALELLKQCYVDEGATIPGHCDWDFFEEYFDIDKMAWAAAMTVVLNSYHAWIDDNLRLFWDPARGKFEPIPWDYLYYAIDPDIHVEGELVNFGYRQSMNSTPEFRRLRDVPKGIRIPVAAVKGQCPRPLDDGDP